MDVADTGVGVDRECWAGHESAPHLVEVDSPPVLADRPVGADASGEGYSWAAARAPRGTRRSLGPALGSDKGGLR